MLPIHNEPELAFQTIYIYALGDPETGLIRYVGKSIRPKERLQNHINEPPCNCHRSHWLQSLKAKGLKPLIIILEEIRGEWPWQEAERFWIRYLKHMGVNLTNNTSGGDGVTNLPPETRAKMRLTWLGRKHTPEALEKLRRRPRRKASMATKKKMSKAQKGRKILWIDKIAAKNRKLAPEKLDAIRSRIAAGELVKDLAVEFGVDRTTMSKVKDGTYLLPYRARLKKQKGKAPKSSPKEAQLDLFAENGETLGVSMDADPEAPDPEPAAQEET